MYGERGDLNGRVELRILKCALARCIDRNNTGWFCAGVLELLDLVEMDAGRSELGGVGFAVGADGDFSVDAAGGRGNGEDCVGLVAAAVEGDLCGVERLAVRCGLGEGHVSIADGILDAAVHGDVRSQGAGDGRLLTGEFGEFSDVEL